MTNWRIAISLKYCYFSKKSQKTKSEIGKTTVGMYATNPESTFFNLKVSKKNYEQLFLWRFFCRFFCGGRFCPKIMFFDQTEYNMSWRPCSNDHFVCGNTCWTQGQKNLASIQALLMESYCNQIFFALERKNLIKSWIIF